MKAKPRSREAALKAWETRRKRYHYMTNEENRLRRNQLARQRYKTDPTVREKQYARTKKNIERVREREKILYWKHHEKCLCEAREYYKKVMSDPIKKARMYANNRKSERKHKYKHTEYRVMWRYFHRNGIKNPTQEEKEIYKWIHKLRKERPRGRSREIAKSDNATLEKQLQALYQRLESNPLSKSSIKMRRQSET